jgi:CDP-paratose 2-epimerase
MNAPASHPAPPTSNLLRGTGLLEWIRIGEYERAEAIIEDLRTLGVQHLRTGLSWADFFSDDGPAWFDWLLPRLADVVELLPCALYVPPSISRKGNVTSPPRNPEDFGDFLDTALDRYGEHFEYVELWNEGNNHHYWDWYDDPEWKAFAEMISSAAKLVKERGWKTVLGGMSPTDPPWLYTMGRYGVLDHIDVVGVHGFPDTWDDRWLDWEDTLGSVRETLDHGGWPRELWITEAGYATWRHDEHRQVLEFVRAAESSADRVYWYSLTDFPPDLPADSGFHRDERHYHFGLKRADGTRKLLYRLLADGSDALLRDVARHAERVPAMPEPPPEPDLARRNGRSEHPVLITGGAGFVGTNVAARLAEEGRRVRIFDSLARPGVETNLNWLTETYPDRIEVELGDLRNTYAVRHAVREVGAVYHFAGQVAVTTSLDAPVRDFAANLRGTVNLLEAVRDRATPPPLLFTSTNKVYGNLDDVPLEKRGSRYEPVEPDVRAHGISENRPLDFHSPYGCSKGAADQYVLDYARSYDLPTVVFRMSCIYGPHQFGTEDQGWVAHFLIRALQGEPITLFGDGHQVRDILFVEDLVEAMLCTTRRIERTAGRAFNVGGGPVNTTSLIELLDTIGDLMGQPPEVRFDDWRQGDQRYYVADTRALEAATGWVPTVGIREGVGRLHDWLAEHHVALAAPAS